MRRYVPLILVELYLITSLALYFFGPINYNTHNLHIFIPILFFYHLSFIFGYYLAKKLYVFDQNIMPFGFTSLRFYIFFIIALYLALLNYKNLMLADSIIPFNLFKDLLYGIENPGLAYTERQLLIRDGVTSESRLLNVLSIFIAFSKLFFIFFSIHFWKLLKPFHKLLFFTYLFLFVSSGIASGTNSVIFIFFIFTLSALALKLYQNNSRFFKPILICSGFIILIPISFFGYIMSQRGGGFDYFESTSPLRDIAGPYFTPDLAGPFEFFYYSWVWLNYYLTQGYYGFSLILNLDWNWTFGFGNSAFLQRQIELIANVNVAELTYQAKISHLWDTNAQWHSFYGHFANDFGLLGLGVFMFAIGFLLSRVWDSVTIGGSFFGSALLVLFPLFFLFFPANNLVLGYLDTISYVIFCLLMWIFEGKKIRIK